MSILISIGLIVSCSTQNDNKNEPLINNGRFNKTIPRSKTVSKSNIKDSIEITPIDTTKVTTIDTTKVTAIDTTEVTTIDTTKVITIDTTKVTAIDTTKVTPVDPINLIKETDGSIIVGDGYIIEFKSVFTHRRPDCDEATTYSEINCVEVLKLENESYVSISIGGGDVIYYSNYKIVDDMIEIEIKLRRTTISFVVQDELTLQRVDNGDIWNKEK